MGHWLARPADTLRFDWLKRFDPRFWTVNFARPMMGAVTTTGADALRVDLAFLKSNDLAGLIWESEDRWDHPLLRYATRRDYRGVTLAFRWRSLGVMPLDAVNGPVLTIEGRDASGAARAWYVRLWNYAQGTAEDAEIALDFGALDGGFLLPGEADPVWAGDVDRLFVSLVPPGYDGVDAPLPSPAEAWVELSGVRCDGAGSTIPIGDAFVPPHALRIASGYDDSYNQTPARLLRGMAQMGYSGPINHYVGMSHYPALRWDGARYVADPARPLCGPAAAWHADFAARAAGEGFGLILSLSFELLDQNCPEAWKQRDASGNPALTGWSPPSTLLSPANAAAMAYLGDVAAALVGIAVAAGQAPRFQVGEPWWWVGANRAPCFYDAAATAAFTAETGFALPPPMSDVRVPVSAAHRTYLDWLGTKLGAATLNLRDRARAAASGCEALLLVYTPQVARADAPDLLRANLPAAWASPAWDVLQLEDYDFVVAGDFAGQARTAALGLELGYPPGRQHYFAGFVLDGAQRALWPQIADAAAAAAGRGVAATFVWAWPQVARDGFVAFDIAGDEDVPAFHDVLFPLELGFGAAGGPAFATQVAVTASGFEQRNAAWADARLHYDAGLGVRSEADLAALVAFFRARRGQAHGFRFRDPFDHSSRDDGAAETAHDQPIGTGDGTATRFALTKTYGDPGEAQVRRITRPVPGSVRVAVAGVERSSGWTLAPGGAIDFAAAPPAGAAVTAGYRFDVPVRFADDRIEVSLAGYRTGELPSVPLIEVREA